jgi:hypothetical protein
MPNKKPQFVQEIEKRTGLKAVPDNGMFALKSPTGLTLFRFNGRNNLIGTVEMPNMYNLHPETENRI